MAKITRFEELIAWQKARVMTREIYRVTESGKFAQDFGLKDRIQRAAVSVMSNIAEGFERGGRAEFHQLLSIATESCGEVRSQLYVAADAGYLDSATFSSLLSNVEEVGELLVDCGCRWAGCAMGVETSSGVNGRRRARSDGPYLA